MTIKSRNEYRHYYSGERVRVTGWAEVNGERWCRIRHEGDEVSTMLAHPRNLIGLDSKSVLETLAEVAQ